MLGNNGLEQPDEIGYSVPLHEGLLASVPRQRCFKPGCQDLWKHRRMISEIVIRWCFSGDSAPASFNDQDSLPVVEGSGQVACQQPHIEDGAPPHVREP